MKAVENILKKSIMTDDEKYQNSRPHFIAAWESAIADGYDLKRFVAELIERYGEGIKPYIRQFLVEMRHQPLNKNKLPETDITTEPIEIQGNKNVEIYSFKMEEEEFSTKCTEVVRALLCRTDLTAYSIHLFAITLRALERLPLVTPGVGIDITLGQTYGDQGRDFQRFKIDDESILLSTGELLYASYGSDYSSSNLIEIGVGWRTGDAEGFEIEDWFSAFLDRANSYETKVNIDDFAGSEIDWNDETDSRPYWEQLDSDY